MFHVLAQALADDAFQPMAGGARLTEEHFSTKLKVHPKYDTVPLPFREDMMEIPLFRANMRGEYGIEISPIEPYSDDALREVQNRLSRTTGFKELARLYNFRRAAGDAFESRQ